MTKQKCYRHGENLLVLVDSLPKEELELSKSKVFMTGSHGHKHSIDKGEIYFIKNKKENDFAYGYLVAKGTSLIHEEHSPKVGDAKLPDGIYKLVKQTEYTAEGLIPVAD